MTLVEAVRVGVLQVGGVTVDGHDAGGEDDAPHRRRPVGRIQDMARAASRRLDEIAHRFLHLAHDEGRGGVEDEGAPRHGAVEAVPVQKIRPVEGQRPAKVFGDLAQVSGSCRVAGIAHGRVDIEAAFQQPLDEPRRNVPVSTCHEYRPRGSQRLVGHDPPAIGDNPGGTLKRTALATEGERGDSPAMTSGPSKGRDGLRFAAGEPPPHPFSLVVGLQVAILVTVPIVIVATIVARVADQSDAYLSWAVFAGMVIGGLMTIVQSKRIGPLGADNLIVMGMSGASIGVAVLALVTGGPALLGTLVVASALCQFALAARLSLLRRIITPLVSGTLLALVSVTVMPMGFAMLTRVPESASPAAAPAIAAVTMLAVVALMLRAPRRFRAWTPIIGIGVGCATAAFFGVLDLGRVASASWLGVPAVATPGPDLDFDARFWVLLPGFLFVTFVITVRQVGDAVRMQRISRRKPKAVDFRRVQGAVAACGSGTLLSGLAGIPAPWPYAAGIGLADGVGIAARRVGVYIGAIVIALAFVPKIAVLVLSIPAPVLGAYIVVIFGIAFAQGMRVAFREGPERRNSLIAGLSFWIGAGIQFQAIFPSHLATPTGRMLANGLTAGGLTILLLNLFVQLTGPRRHRTEMRLSADRQPDLDRFMVDFAARYAWPARTTERLRAAAEEALLSLVRQEQDEHAPAAEGRRLRVVARNLRGGRTAGVHRGHPRRQPGERDVGPGRITRPPPTNATSRWRCSGITPRR